MQSFAEATPNHTCAVWSFDDVGFIFHRNRGKPKHLPVPLLQYMPDQIVFMQTLHNNNDAAGIFVVQSAKEGVIEPLIDGIALCLGQCLFGLTGVVNDDEVAASTR